MRTFVLILMLALLPMRMWAAEGMSVRMAAGQAASHDASAQAPMPQDCPMAAEAAAADEAPGQSPVSQCTTCHLCAVAAYAPGMACEPPAAPARMDDLQPAVYLSASVAPGLRPPIS